MKLYLDTASVADWQSLMPTGIFHGITTNPLLAARAGLSYRTIDWRTMARKAADLGAKELHAQVHGDPDGYADWAATLYDIGKETGIQTVVKIPLVEPAIRATPDIKALGGPILMTACYDAKQMFIAQALDADFIPPYYGRMSEAGIDAKSHLSAMKAIQPDHGDKCEILVASLRGTSQMVELAQLGMDVFTIAPDIAHDLLREDNSEIAFKAFELAAGS